MPTSWVRGGEGCESSSSVSGVKRTFDAKQKTAGVSQSYPFFVAATTECTRDHRRQSCLALSLARTQLTLDSLLSLLNSRSTGGTAGEQQEHRRLVSNERCSHESERRE